MPVQNNCVFLAIVGLVLLHLCKTIAIAFTTNDCRERDCVATREQICFKYNIKQRSWLTDSVNKCI